MQFQFDARTVQPSFAAGGKSLPVSDKKGHLVVIIGSELKPTNDGNGMRLVLECGIMEGPHKGETGDFGLNVGHANPKTVEMAYKQLSAICHVTQRYNITDTTQLHNVPFRIIVEPQKGEKGAEGYTNVVGVLDVAGNDPGKGPAPQQQQAPQPQQAAPPPMQNVAPGGWAPQPAPAAAQGGWGPPQPATAPAPAPAPAQPPQGGGQPAWAPQGPATAPAGGAPPWAR